MAPPSAAPSGDCFLSNRNSVKQNLIVFAVTLIVLGSVLVVLKN